MFVRKLAVVWVDAEGMETPCPIRWIDNFAMRNFTNDAVFDDTLPVGDGRMEAGLLVPLERLQAAMEDWFRRKGYLKANERLRVTEMAVTEPPKESGRVKETAYDSDDRLADTHGIR